MCDSYIALNNFQTLYQYGAMRRLMELPGILITRTNREIYS